MTFDYTATFVDRISPDGEVDPFDNIVPVWDDSDDDDLPVIDGKGFFVQT